MLKSIFKTVVVGAYLISAGMCCNYQLLDLRADTFNERIWNENPAPIKKIQENLDFLEDDLELIEKYNAKDFSGFFEKIKKDVPDEHFIKFSENCQQIYQDQEEQPTKAAVYILLEKVYEKAVSNFNNLQAVESFLKNKDQQFLDEKTIGKIKQASDTFLHIKEEDIKDLGKIEKQNQSHSSAASIYSESEKKSGVSVRLSKIEHDKLQRYCSKINTSMSDYIRKIIADLPDEM